MTKEELAAMLDGRQYLNEITTEIENFVYKNNLLIVFGYSDDLCEFRGAICYEFDCCDGGIIKCWNLPKSIEVIWCPDDKDCSWTYETELPYAEFKIYDGDKLYCIGIVVDLNEADKEYKSFLSPEYVAKEMLAASQKGIEQAHKEMDEIMLKTLTALGYGETVKIFRDTLKWYA